VKVNLEYPGKLSLVGGLSERTRFTPAVNGGMLSLHQDSRPARSFIDHRATIDRVARRRLRSDERAVEGMPVRLLVAVTVGVAAVTLLLPLPQDVADEEAAELTVEPEQTQIRLGENVTVAVVTESGRPVEDATLLVRGRSLRVPGEPYTVETGEHSNTVTLQIGTTIPAAFRPTQRRGTIAFEVLLDGSASYTDDRTNPEVTVIAP